MSGRYAAARGNVSWLEDAIAAVLVSEAYDFDENHTRLAQIDGLVGDPVQLTDKRNDGGWLSCADLNFLQVRGDPAVALLFYRSSDGMPIEYHTAIEDFPITPNGGDIELAVSEPGIFRI